jgi:hypothetical protein
VGKAAANIGDFVVRTPVDAAACGRWLSRADGDIVAEEKVWGLQWLPDQRQAVG